MATLIGPFRYSAASVWPRHFGWRLICYLAISVLAWLTPPWGSLGALLAIVGLGRKIGWMAWLAGLKWLWFFILAPVLVEILAGLFTIGQIAPIPLSTSLWRSLTFLVLLAGSQWLTQSTTIFEIRSALHNLFRITGPKAADLLSLVGALALCFLPWVMAEIQAVREAGQIRGLPTHRPFTAMRSLAIPLGVRLIQKARHTADALELRGR